MSQKELLTLASWKGDGAVPFCIFIMVEGELRQLDPEAAGDHIDALFRAACAMSGSRALAEDLVQETYVKVLSKPRLIRRDDDLGYLIKALRNTWYSHLRSERTKRAATADAVEDPDRSARRRRSATRSRRSRPAPCSTPSASCRSTIARRSPRSTSPGSATRRRRRRSASAKAP